MPSVLISGANKGMSAAERNEEEKTRSVVD
jgi:hypothetical protein